MKSAIKKWRKMSEKISFVTYTEVKTGRTAKNVDTFVERPVKSILLDIIVWDEAKTFHMAYIKPSWGLGQMIYDSQGLNLAFYRSGRNDKVEIDIINKDFRSFHLDTRVHIEFETGCDCEMRILLMQGCQCGGE